MERVTILSWRAGRDRCGQREEEEEPNNGDCLNGSSKELSAGFLLPPQLFTSRARRAFKSCALLFVGSGFIGTVAPSVLMIPRMQCDSVGGNHCVN